MRLGLWSAGFFFFVAFVAVVLVPTGEAQTEAKPAPPPSVVVRITEVIEWQPWDPLFQSNANLTFQLSPEDPDQVNGTFTYYYWLDDFRVATPITPMPIPGRVGWVYAPLTYASDEGDPGVFNFSLTTNNTAEFESVRSCSFLLELRENGSHRQCGPSAAGGVGIGGDILPPLGVSTVVASVATPSAPATVEVRWLLSPDDPEPVNGSFSYRVFRQFVDHGAVAGFFRFRTVEVGGVTVNESAGQKLMTVNISAAPGEARGGNFWVVAYDANGTAQLSEMSCVVYSGEVLQGRAGCGSLGLPGFPAAGEVSFPFVDVPAVGVATGMSSGMIGAFLGVGFLVGLAALGFVLGGAITAGVAGVVGLGFLATLGVVPIWLLVLVFLVAAAVVVLTFRGGGSG